MAVDKPVKGTVRAVAIIRQLTALTMVLVCVSFIHIVIQTGV